MEASNGILSLFPFVCGICDAKFNGIAIYFSHIQEHSIINEYLHCCFEANRKPSEEENVYSCGKCQFKFPSLCTLYQHLLEDEVVTEFVFRNEDKTAYELNAQNIGKTLVNNSVDEHEDTGEDVGWFGDSMELYNDSKTDSDSSLRFSEVTKKTCKVRTKENSLSKKKRSLNRSYDENNTTDVDNECTYACDEVHDMNNPSLDKLADDITESGTSSIVAGKSRVGKPRAVDSYYPCEVCGGIYKYDVLSSHKAVHAKRTFQCDQCHLKFSSKARLTQHKTFVHATENKYTCHECGKSFKALPYLRQHGKRHLKERTAECPLCHKMFKDQKAVRVHMISHSEERPYKCSRCDKSFKRSKDLEGHEEGVHLAIEKYPCVDCNKLFKTRSAVRKHMLIHQPPKHFCEVCGKSFSQHSNMRIHMRVHSKGV